NVKHCRYLRKTKGPSGFPLSPSYAWWSQTGSNRRPLQCHCSALPAELWPRNLCWRRRYKSGLAAWQPQRLAVALALVVLDFDLDLVGLVGEVVGVLQRLVVGLQVYRVFVRVLHFLALGERQLGRRRRCRGGRRSRRRCRRSATAATDLHEVFAIVLTAALGTLDRTLVQVVEARRTILAGALGAPGRLDHTGSPGNFAVKGL